MKLVFRLPLIALLFSLGFAFNVDAQSTSKSVSKLALEGYCPVAYHVLKKAVKGKKEYSSVYEGKDYRFVNGKAKKMFDADPGKFLPKYGGYCATAMSMGKKLKSDPRYFTEYKGDTYLFSSKKAKKMFDKDPGKYIKKADAKFTELNKK